MTRTVSTFVPIEGIDVVVLAHGGTEVRVVREAPFSTDDRRLVDKLSAHPRVELVGAEQVEDELEVIEVEDENDGEAGDGEAGDGEANPETEGEQEA